MQDVSRASRADAALSVGSMDDPYGNEQTKASLGGALREHNPRTLAEFGIAMAPLRASRIFWSGGATVQRFLFQARANHLDFPIEALPSTYPGALRLLKVTGSAVRVVLSQQGR